MQADAAYFSQNSSSGKLSKHECFIANISEDAQRTLHDVTYLFVLPLATLLALLSLTCNSVTMIAIFRMRSIQSPSLLLLCSLSTTDVIWAIITIIINTKTFTHKHLCPKRITAKEEGFAFVLCFFSTLGSIAFMSCDRCLAVGKPWWYRNRVRRSHTIRSIAVLWVISVIVSVVVTNQKYFPWIWQTFLFISVGCCAFFILATICCYVVVLIVSARRKSAMHLYGRHMRTIVMLERRIATTVGLIILFLCFTHLPVLAAPFMLYHLGYPFEDQPPFRPFYYIFVTVNGLLNPLVNHSRNRDVQREVHSLIKCQRLTREVRLNPNEDNRHRRITPFSLRRSNRVAAAQP